MTALLTTVFERFEQVVRETRPAIVGITALITTRGNALALAEIAKEYGCYVIFGGPDPTGKPERYLKHTGKDGDGNPVVDIIVWDEGEETIVELMNHLVERGDFAPDLSEIAGLRYLDSDGKVVSTEHRAPIQDVDALPFPARDLVDIEAYRRAWSGRHGYWSLSIINTRGCPYACTWCQKGIFGRTYRSRSAENSALGNEAY